MKNIKTINELKKDYCLFVQVYIKEKPYLRYAPRKENCYHANILYTLLKKEFSFECKIRKDKCGDEVPIEKDKDFNYELVGAGKAKYILWNTIKFYDSSSSYLMGVNLRHLENVFKDKKIKIIEDEKRGLEKSFLVEFNGDGEPLENEESF